MIRCNLSKLREGWNLTMFVKRTFAAGNSIFSGILIAQDSVSSQWRTRNIIKLKVCPLKGIWLAFINDFLTGIGWTAVLLGDPLPIQMSALCYLKRGLKLIRPSILQSISRPIKRTHTSHTSSGIYPRASCPAPNVAKLQFSTKAPSKVDLSQPYDLLNKYQRKD